MRVRITVGRRPVRIGSDDPVRGTADMAAVSPLPEGLTLSEWVKKYGPQDICRHKDRPRGKFPDGKYCKKSVRCQECVDALQLCMRKWANMRAIKTGTLPF